MLVPANKMQSRDSRLGLLFQSPLYNRCLPSTVRLLAGPVLTETKSNAVKCERAESIGSPHQAIQGRWQS